MPLETQISVFLRNRVGSLNELCTALSEAGINIRAMSTVDDVDWSVVGLIVDDITKAKEILDGLGLRYGESTVLTVDIPNRPGAMAEVTRKLSSANINIVHTFLTATGNNCMVVFLTTDNKKAEEVLRS